MLAQGPQTSLELLETTVIKTLAEHTRKNPLSALIREKETVITLLEQGTGQEAVVSSTAGVWPRGRTF